MYLTGQLWDVDIIILLPFLWIAWTKFFRNGFILHYLIEEGENLREIGTKWFVPLHMEGQHINVKVGGRGIRRGTKATLFIDGGKTIYTDRFNKRHLAFPLNNTFAFHPFADEILLPANAKEVISKVPSSIWSKIKHKSTYDTENGNVTEETHRTDTEYHISPVKINLVSLIKFDAIKLFKYFFGEAMVLRVEQARNKNKTDRSTQILYIAIGAILVFGLVNADPQLFGLQHTPVIATPPVSTTTTTSNVPTTTTTQTTTVAPTTATTVMTTSTSYKYTVTIN